MDPLAGQGYPSAFKAIRTLKRRLWIVVLTTVVVAGVAVVVSRQEQPLYQAESQVLLKFQSLASGLAGVVQDLSVRQDPARIAETQTQVAMSQAVGRRVVAVARVPGLDANEFLDSASVTASPDSDILEFRVTYSDPSIAARLATLHAREYIAHRVQLDTAALVVARKELAGRITELRASDLRNSPLMASLVEAEQQLRTLEALQTANASLLRAADDSVQVQPKPVRNAVLGVILGLMLGVGLAFARDALDTRLRSAAEIAERLPMPLLARVPAPPRKLRANDRLVMMAQPHGPQAEAFRMLRANLDFVNLDRGARTVLVTSALEREGKTTTVANLAVVLARSGRRVALVDLDLRRPSIHRFFEIERSHPGISSVVLGHLGLDQAMVEVFRPVRETEPGGGSNGNSSSVTDGVLHILPSGRVPSDPGEFVNSPRLAGVLQELAEAYDFVLIDTPPVLSVGDAMSLSARADAMIAVTRLNLLKRPTLQELARALSTWPTVKLGFVVTGAEMEQGYEYAGYEYGYGSTTGQQGTRAREPLR